MQPKEEIEASYSTPDPWGYQVNPDDHLRKQIILGVLNAHQYKFGPFERALDIGAGEAWITKDLPAETRHGFELSAQARSRMPDDVVPVNSAYGSYDLVVATGVMYTHYDCAEFFKLIREHASKVILTCNIQSWEHQMLKDQSGDLSFLNGKEIFKAQFPYREYVQQLRVFHLR
jgi:hypothetical protein